jgi:hypothetical protein
VKRPNKNKTSSEERVRARVDQQGALLHELAMKRKAMKEHIHIRNKEELV